MLSLPPNLYLAATTSTTTFSWDFSQGASGWQGGFADYPAGEEDFFELDSGLRSLPPKVGDETALFITGSNRSDDLFMYFRNRVTGLEPETTYEVVFDVEFASNAPDGSFGIGGSPANSVFLKAGATQVEPIAVDADMDDFLRLSVDKGIQSQAGQDSVLLGDVAKPPGDEGFDYGLVTRSNAEMPFTFRTDGDGKAWLYFGTDSGFEGTTALYYTNFRAEFRQVSDAVGVPEPSSLVLLVGVSLGLIVGMYRKVMQ